MPRSVLPIAGAVLLSVAVLQPAAAQISVAGMSDTAIVAAAIDHVANTAPGRLMYLDPRRLNPVERTGPHQWLSNWQPELLRALRLDYRLIKGTAMTNGALSCKPVQAVENSTPSMIQRGSALPLRQRESAQLLMPSPTTVYLGVAIPEIDGDSVRVLVSVCDAGRFNERLLVMVREVRKWKVKIDEVQQRN